MKINLLAILILLLFVQCSSTRQVQIKENYLRLNKYNLALVNGTYMLRDSSEFEFWKEIICKKKKEKFQVYKNSKVVMKFEDETKLRMTLIFNDSTIREKEIIGYIENGFFVFSKTNREKVFPLLWILNTKTIQICATKKGFYVADDDEALAFILIFPFFGARGWGAEDKEYEKINILVE